MNEFKNIDNLKKLKILIIIVPDGKKEIITDLLEEYEVNFSFYLKGNGTVTNDLIEMLGLESNQRDVIFSFIKSEKVNDAMLALEDKFNKFKYHQSIAFAIPLYSIIGLQNYMFLANSGGEYFGK